MYLPAVFTFPSEPQPGTLCLPPRILRRLSKISMKILLPWPQLHVGFYVTSKSEASISPSLVGLNSKPQWPSMSMLCRLGFLLLDPWVGEPDVGLDFSLLWENHCNMSSFSGFVGHLPWGMGFDDPASTSLLPISLWFLFISSGRFQVIFINDDSYRAVVILVCSWEVSRGFWKCSSVWLLSQITWESC